MRRVLILCTGNSCRSQMAEVLLKQMSPKTEVLSAGTKPEEQVHPLAIRALNEIGIETSDLTPKSVDQFVDENFDYVITVCDHARESCPLFHGSVSHRLHLGFEDPARFVGSEEEKIARFRQIRDEIKEAFKVFYQEHLADE